jgi:hypothetical protein
MKGKEALMLLAILGVGFWAITRWAGQGSTASRLLSPITSRFGVAPVAKPAETAGANQHGKPDRAKRSTRKRSDSTVSDSAFPDEPSTITVMVPSAHYPKPEELKLGSTGTDIRSQFGEPSARVAGVRDGVLMERYYYLNGDRTLLTVATLQNGLLVSAQSQRR